MSGHSCQGPHILLTISKGGDMNASQFLFQQKLEVLTCDLFTFTGRHHSLIGQTLSNLFDPIVESRYKGIFDLKCG